MKVALQSIKDRQWAAHLVLVALPVDRPFGGSEVRQALYLLDRLIKQQEPAGDYATTPPAMSGPGGPRSGKKATSLRSE